MTDDEDPASVALAAALDTMGENRAAEDVRKLRKALALRGYTVVPIPPDRTATRVEHRDGRDRVVRSHPVPEHDLTVFDGMGVDMVLDGVARLAAQAAESRSSMRWSAGEAALLYRAVRARRSVLPDDDASARWGAVVRGLAAGRPLHWSADDAVTVRGVLFMSGYPRRLP